MAINAESRQTAVFAQVPNGMPSQAGFHAPGVIWRAAASVETYSPPPTQEAVMRYSIARLARARLPSNFAALEGVTPQVREEVRGLCREFPLP